MSIYENNFGQEVPLRVINKDTRESSRNRSRSKYYTTTQNEEPQINLHQTSSDIQTQQLIDLQTMGSVSKKEQAKRREIS